MPSQVPLKAIFCRKLSHKRDIPFLKQDRWIRYDHLKHLNSKSGTQKNLSNETVLLSTQNTYIN